MVAAKAAPTEGLLFVGGAFAPNQCPDGNSGHWEGGALHPKPLLLDLAGSRLKPLLPIEIGLPGRSRAGRRPSPTQKTPSWSAQADRRPQAFMPIEIGLPGRSRAGRRPPPTQKAPSRSAQADRWPKAFTPIEIGLPGRCAPGVGLRRRKRHPPGRRRPTAGRRPSRRLKSAFQGAARRASAFADAKSAFPVGAGRPLAEGPWRPNSFGAQADCRPEAFTPIEIGLPGRSRARRRPPPTQKTPSRSAQADRWPKAPPGRIHSAHRPTASHRPPGRIHSTPPTPRVGLQPGLPHPPTHLRPYQPQKGKAPPYSIARRTCATSASSGASPASAQARR